jgi:predicted AAA+ superfamily ATPase
MKRINIEKLISWSSKKRRFPLIIKGARQVGKTYLVREFGSKYFPNLHEFNFESDPRLRSLFDSDLNPQQIIRQIELVFGTQIKGDDLLFFDEIQECPRAITALKHFAEYLPSQPVIAAGSLLGVSLPSYSFPVGKVEHLWLGPLTFSEFLSGTEESGALEILEEAEKNLKISHFGHQRLWELFKAYSMTGGLPNAVLAYTQHKENISIGLQAAREVQLGLVRDYTSDFSKYTEKLNASHIRTVYENIPEQLSASEDRSSKKYAFGKVIPNRSGYADLRGPIDWLVRAGLIYRIPIANKAEIPLRAFCKDNFFKLYHFDIGMLGALLRLPPASIIANDYGMSRGFFAEALALQGLVADDLDYPACWMEGQSEIEFIHTGAHGLVPIEVKSSTRTKSKSLAAYIKRYSPRLAVKLANRLPEYDAQTKTWTLPLYMAPTVRKLEPR